ncbi:MAG: DUF3486 family protein, partial [Burkholderiaceae bacterium]|nr:DUF3486 family protein [Burkholderiaceae bacterium]
SRRLRYLVARTGTAQGIASLIRRCILDWGVPDTVHTDNGQDYVAVHLKTFLRSLEIQQRLCAPFSPWEKPHIERSMRSMSHDLVELLPGFVGHNVAQRAQIEDRKAFSAGGAGAAGGKQSAAAARRRARMDGPHRFARPRRGGRSGPRPRRSAAAPLSETHAMPRRNKVQSLTPELRAEIERLLIQRGFSGYAELEQQILDAHGVEIGKSTLHRYGSKLERKLDAIRASTEAARLIADAAPDDADQRSAAVISLVQSNMFEALLNLQDAEGDDVDPGERVKLLGQAARAMAEASRASIGQKKWQSEVSAKLDALEAAQGQGKKRLDATTLKAVREALYGG